MKKIITFYFLFLFSILCIFSAGVIDSTDGFQYLVVARNIYYKGEPTTRPYEYSERKNIHMTIVDGKNGKHYSLTGLGFSLAYLPAVAITDIVYKLYDVTPQIYFPLENDWLIFLIAGFTNAFIGAILGVILLSYFVILGLSKKQAIFLSLISIFTTNLFVYTKHSMPHMMFVTLLMLSFMMIKFYSLHRKNYLLFFSGFSFGFFMITYNPTFILAIPPLFLYYLMLLRYKIGFKSLKSAAKNILFFIVGMFPFILMNGWFENARAIVSTSNLISAGTNYINNSLPLGIFFEGVYGQLLSPGRSIFIYSPLLLAIILFWHKVKKNIYPELVSFILYGVILIVFYAKAFTIGRPDQGIEGLWHGESSWGPRYLTSLIPLGMLVVGYIYKYLSKKERYLVLFLASIGLFIEILGVLIPYQTKYANLEKSFFLNGSLYTSFTYNNLIPRYTPLLTMSKNLIKLGQNFPKTYDHGEYNLKFYDGIDFPFNVGPERWRVVEGKGEISFDENQKDPVRELAFGVINHPITEASLSAKLNVLLNNNILLDQPIEIKPTERLLVKLLVNKEFVKPKANQLTVQVSYDDLKVLIDKSQILGIQFFDINGKRQNMESIDVPYVSVLGPKITGVTYQNWGGTNTDPWRIWDIHTQTYERLPDLWWIRNLYYWDVPKTWIIVLFLINITGLVFSGVKLRRNLV